MIFSFVTSSLDYFNSHKQRQQEACMDKHATPAKTEAQKGNMQEVEAELRWPRRNMGLAGREWEKPKQPRVECRYVEGERGFYMISKGKTKENVHLLLNGHSPWSQRIWEGLRYLMSSFASGRHIIPAFRNPQLLLPWEKCGATKTFSGDNDGVKEYLRWTHRCMGSNRMQPRMLRELADVLARPLSKLSLKCHSNCKRCLVTGRKQGEL